MIQKKYQKYIQKCWQKKCNVMKNIKHKNKQKQNTVFPKLISFKMMTKTNKQKNIFYKFAQYAIKHIN